jgi:branched-chain amino acid transport system ATP-binding protein
MLEVRGLNAFYGKSQILRGVDLMVGDREIVSILGRNGTGRSTTLKAIMGVVQREGSIRFRGEEMQSLKPYEIARKGLGFVPEERAIFPNLTVMQNLILGSKAGRQTPGWSFDETWAIFPQLHERADAPAGVLSGGEQQMLTICRTLMGNPSLIMIDEPTEGLAPQMVERVGDLLTKIAERGIAILLVEQKLTIALDISHRLYVMGHGKMVFEGSTDSFRADRAIQTEWLEV